MKKLIALLLALVMVLGLAACGGSEPAPEAPKADAPAAPEAEAPAAPEVDDNNPLYTKPTENVHLTIWYAVSGVTAEKFEALVNEYVAANPNVTVELSYAGSYADAANKISANLLTNTAPDVALTTAAPMFTGDRGDYTLETLIQDPAFDAAGIYNGVWDYAEWQGRVCALPYGISVPVLYYNKTIAADMGLDLEANPPKSWDELYAIAEKAVADGKAAIGFDVNDVAWLFKSMLAQNGNAIIEADGDDITPIYNQANATEVAAFWQKLTANGLMPVDQHGNADKNFQGGQTLFLVSSSVRLARWAGVEGIADFGCLPLPSFAQESAALGGNHLVVFPNGDDVKLAAAWDLLKYLMSEEKHPEFAIEPGYLPIYAAAMETDYVKNAIAEDGRRQTVYNYLENGMAPQDALDKAVENLLNDM